MLKPTPPNVSYTSKMTVYQGQREIQLLFLGRGHTPGDTVVYLPKERIVCSGDLMETQPAYMGDAIFDEWLKTLDALKEMNFDTVLPGHGVPFHDKSLITAYQSYLTDLMSQVAALRKQGVSADDAAKKVDMTSHSRDFPQIQGPGAEVRGHSADVRVDGRTLALAGSETIGVTPVRRLRMMVGERAEFTDANGAPSATLNGKALGSFPVVHPSR